MHQSNNKTLQLLTYTQISRFESIGFLTELFSRNSIIELAKIMCCKIDPSLNQRCIIFNKYMRWKKKLRKKPYKSSAEINHVD